MAGNGGNKHKGTFKKNTNMVKGYTPLHDSDIATHAEYLNRAEANKEKFRKLFSLWRHKPDLFVDFITPSGSPFKLFFYQRVFLRVAMRYKYVYATFTRAFSKSFLSIMALYLKCIFYPGIKLFISSGTKEQAASIISHWITRCGACKTSLTAGTP